LISLFNANLLTKIIRFQADKTGFTKATSQDLFISNSPPGIPASIIRAKVEFETET